jgi:hypothetical protein
VRQIRHRLEALRRCCRPLNGLSGPISIAFYPTSIRAVKFATEPH